MHRVGNTTAAVRPDHDGDGDGTLRAVRTPGATPHLRLRCALRQRDLRVSWETATATDTCCPPCSPVLGETCTDGAAAAATLTWQAIAASSADRNQPKRRIMRLTSRCS